MTDSQKKLVLERVKRLFGKDDHLCYYQDEYAVIDTSILGLTAGGKTFVYSLMLTQEDILGLFGLRVKDRYQIQVGPSHDQEYLTISSPIHPKCVTSNQYYLDECFDTIEPLMKRSVPDYYVPEKAFYMDSIHYEISIFGRILLTSLLNDSGYSDEQFMNTFAALIYGIEKNLEFCRKKLGFE